MRSTFRWISSCGSISSCSALHPAYLDGLEIDFMAIAIIPARYASTRLPGKPLVSLAGKPMIERVWERARRAKKISRVIIATDDERIMQAAAAFGGEAVMTRSEHRSGTERVAEVAATAAHEGEEIFVNVQGDEPLIEPDAIDAARRGHRIRRERVGRDAHGPHRQACRHHGPQRRQSRSRFRRQRAVFFARADSLGARPRMRRCTRST